MAVARNVACGLVGLAMFAGQTLAQSPVGPDSEAFKKARKAGIDYLRSSQADDGSWVQSGAVGITGLCTYSLLLSGVPADDPAVAKALKKLESFAQPDGRVCDPKSRIAGYETSIAVMTLQAANADGKYTPLVKKADQFLRTMQFDEGEKVAKTDPRYGGVGYAPDGGRPDLSNTIFLLEALKAAGAKPDDEAMKKALIFVSRCQNLESEFNTTPPAPKVNDGGFYYSVAGDGISPAGKTEEGGLRSYGSMTYGGFKSLLYAGVGENDPRVKTARDWIRKNYTVKENPGLGDVGLYYYYYLFAKSLDAAQIDLLEDAKGAKHDWRKELAERLFSLQRDNGSWLNGKSDRYFEGNPDLVTAYVLVCLSHCEPKSKP